MNTDVKPSAHGHRSLRSLLLDRRFQVKHTAMILGVATSVSVVLGVFLFDKVRENSRMLELEGFADPAFQAQLAQSDAGLLATLVGSFVVFLLVLTVLSLFITHRMAGPIFVMRRYVKALGDGMIPQVRKLRRGDEFVEFYEALSTCVDAIERRTEDEIDVLRRAIEVLDRDERERIPQVRAEIDRLIQRKQRMLSSRVP